MQYVRFVLLFMASILFGSISSQAAEPATRPGVQIYPLGDIELIAVRDNLAERNRNLLIGDAKRIETLMPEAKTAGSVNTYLIRTKDSLILIDTGWGAPKGQTLENLRQIGITPDKIDTILFTHLHGDHISGLLVENKTVFPNAALYVPAAEYAYWLSDDELNKDSDKTRFTLARQNLLAYGDRVHTFKPGSEIIPGITAIDETGHTPGHVGYLVESSNKKLLVWGDLTHFTEVQLAAPEIAVVYDTTPEHAIASRRSILAWVASEAIPVAGMHILYPGVGRVHARDGGGYVFEPLDKLD